jgi:hypothetical protein
MTILQGWCLTRGFLGCVFDGVDDVLITSAATEIAFKAMANLFA